MNLLEATNLLLLRLNSSPVNSTEDDNRARAVSSEIRHSNNRALETGDWFFALQRVELTRVDHDLDNAYRRFFYRHILPSAIANIHAIEPAVQDYALIGSHVYSNEPRLWLEYTKQLTFDETSPYATYQNFVISMATLHVLPKITDAASETILRLLQQESQVARREALLWNRRLAPSRGIRQINPITTRHYLNSGYRFWR